MTTTCLYCFLKWAPSIVFTFFRISKHSQRGKWCKVGVPPPPLHFTITRQPSDEYTKTKCIFVVMMLLFFVSFWFLILFILIWTTKNPHQEEEEEAHEQLMKCQTTRSFHWTKKSFFSLLSDTRELPFTMCLPFYFFANSRICRIGEEEMKRERGRERVRQTLEDGWQ